MQNSVSPKYDLEKERYVAIQVEDMHYLVDIEACERLMCVSPGVKIFSPSLGRALRVWPEEQVVDEEVIPGLATSHKKVQNAIQNLRRMRPLYG